MWKPARIVWLGAGAVGGALVILLLLSQQKKPGIQLTAEERAMLSAAGRATPFVVPGIKQPPHHDAAHPGIQDNEEVIGVVIGDQPRAYRLAPFFSMTQHVVNDIVAGVPVSVTYCDQVDRARVFTNNQSDGPIDLWCGGWSGEQLLLLLNEQYYVHDSSEIPLSDQPFERMTWGAWKEKHPQSRVYLGPASE